ncbi:MAG TPA: hypothetical protein PLP06_13340, partial [Saprospiraceae bacterium]|nr:hypothetical protein [Saprospiraceae bacterium]
MVINKFGLQKFNSRTKQVANMGEAYEAADIAFDRKGRLFACVRNQILELDTFPNGSPPTPKNVLYVASDSIEFNGMTTDCKGLLWLTGAFGNKKALFTYDPKSNAFLTIGISSTKFNYAYDLDWYNGRLYSIGIDTPGPKEQLIINKINIDDFDKSTDFKLGNHIISFSMATTHDQCHSYGMYSFNEVGNFNTFSTGYYFFNSNLTSLTEYKNSAMGQSSLGATSRTSWMGSYAPLALDSVTTRIEGDNCSGPFSITSHIKRGYYMRPDIQYSLDGITFQSDSIFHDLRMGTYIIHVKDSLGCSISSDSITLGQQKEYAFNQAILYDYCSLGIGEISLKNTD